LHGIQKAMQRLTLTPFSFALAPENDDFSEEVRQMSFGLGRRPSHRVLFTVRRHEVYIFSVRHAAQEQLTPDDLP
jgi:hypothetical protein